MSTVNFTNSVNAANIVLWSYSTKISDHSDRKTTLHARHAEVNAIENLGVGVTKTNPFTNLN